MANKMIPVRVKEPIWRTDENGFTLDVSRTAFKKEPDKVYKVPETGFWMKLIIDGKLTAAGDPEKDKVENPVQPKTAPGPNANSNQPKTAPGPNANSNQPKTTPTANTKK